MHEKEHIQWLEKQGLLEAVKSAAAPLQKVFRQCLDAKKEDVLIIGDKGFENRRIASMLPASYYLAAKELGLNARIIVQEPKFRGDAAENSVIDSLKSLRRESIVVMVISNRLGSLKEIGGSYRAFAKENSHKFISATTMGGLDNSKFSSVIKAIDVDYPEMQERGRKLKDLFDQGEEVHITTKKGTDLYMNIKGKKAIANTGNYRIPGKGGNIPCGEVYMPPKWKHVEGTVVVDGSSSYKDGTQLIKEPIKLTIKKDEVVGIEGGEEANNRYRDPLQGACPYRTRAYDQEDCRGGKG